MSSQTIPNLKRMRCKKHPCEPPGVGVCASCLRERLLVLLAIQSKSETAPASPEATHAGRPEKPFPIPRSVSPYVSSQDRRTHTLFYSTPQLGPLQKNLTKPRGKSSIFSSIFAKKDDYNDGDGDPPVRFSWLTLLLFRRKKKSRLFSVDVSDPTPEEKCCRRDRGLSPVTKMRSEEEEEPGLASGNSLESSSRVSRVRNLGFQEEKQRRRVLQQRNASGFVFCLSPLMRPSPNHRRNRRFHGEQNGRDGPVSGEIKISGKKHCSTSNPSFCTNRSRKLADFGRANEVKADQD